MSNRGRSRALVARCRGDCGPYREQRARRERVHRSVSVAPAPGRTVEGQRLRTSSSRTSRGSGSARGPASTYRTRTTSYIHDVDFAGCGGGIFLLNVTGTVHIENVRGRNIGDGTIGSGHGNLIQFNNVWQSAPELPDGRARIRSIWAYGGDTEDVISVYKLGRHRRRSPARHRQRAPRASALRAARLEVRFRDVRQPRRRRRARHPLAEQHLLELRCGRHPDERTGPQRQGRATTPSTAPPGRSRTSV